MKQAILCVDDESIIVLSLKQELRNYYHERFIYETALNAKEALSVIEEMEEEGIGVIVIISDWLMPGIKGDEFIELVHEKHPDIRAIIMTGQADLQNIARLKETCGLLTVLYKPWRTSDLISAVDRCLAELSP